MFYIAFRIIIGILLGLLVLFLGSSILMSFFNYHTLMQSKPWLSSFINHSAMLIFSILLILIINKGNLSKYGFKMGKSVSWKSIIPLGLAFGIIGSIIQSNIPGKGLTFVGEFTFLQVIIFVWFYASICEEILTRGLMQGYLAPLTKYGFNVFGFRISIPMLVSALFFAAMHLMLLTMSIDKLTVFNIVFFGFILGLFAGYYREKSGSIIPAIIVHILFNIGGTLAMLSIGMKFNKN